MSQRDVITDLHTLLIAAQIAERQKAGPYTLEDAREENARGWRSVNPHAPHFWPRYITVHLLPEQLEQAFAYARVLPRLLPDQGPRPGEHTP